MAFSKATSFSENGASVPLTPNCQPANNKRVSSLSVFTPFQMLTSCWLSSKKKTMFATNLLKISEVLKLIISYVKNVLKYSLLNPSRYNVIIDLA